MGKYTPIRKVTMATKRTIRIPDCSTAEGVKQYIEQRLNDITEYKEFNEDRGGHFELLVLYNMIDDDIGAMLDDMEREAEERAKQMAIKLLDAGVTEEMWKGRRF